MHPAIIRAAEAAVTFFLVTFVVTASGLLSSVDLSDSKAVNTALIAALVGAVQATVKEPTGFSALAVKPTATRRP
jgi:hypothetical protein